ncbi:protein SOB FIVE-LIKE 4-like isoform X2 [Prosopis cineraria]|nr:protein SOB FIVE-LIKE 4-like isoform X2 [Prosopis cineraria]XP_054820295.1 protein SOB FIVE-LIKE 4-like isoform X2 [Prosopis cineraria]
MEQSQSNGGAEECQSSESGWTMYIGSTIDDYEDDDDVDNDHTPQADVEDDESDDSMASDASSGPSHYGNPWENMEGGYGMGEEEHDEKFFLGKKDNNRTRGKQIAGRKEEENETVSIDDKGKVPDQDSDKVRRNFRMAKRK